MSEWQQLSLSEVAPYWTEKVEAQKLNEENFISADNMLSDRQGVINSVYTPTTGKLTSFKPKDILVSNIRPYFKKIWFANKTGGCSNDVIVFRSADFVNARFIYYCLSNNDFFAYMMAGANGTKMPRGNKKSILKYKISLPPLPTQQKIAKILSNYDDLIENNLKRIKLVEESSRLTYEEWFLRFRVDGKKLDINPESKLPFGWGENNLGSLVNLHSGYPFKSSDYGDKEKYKLVTIKNVQDGNFVTKTTDSISYLPGNLKQNQKLDNGDYIMSLTGNVGRVCLVYGKNYLLNQRVVKLEPKKLFDYSFLYLLFRNKHMLIQLENISNGAAQQNLSPVNVSKIKLPIPSEALRENFNAKIKPNIDLIIQLSLKNQLLKEARDILLPRLMTGMIDTDKLKVAV